MFGVGLSELRIIAIVAVLAFLLTPLVPSRVAPRPPSPAADPVDTASPASWASLDPALPRPAAIALAAVASLPVLALLAYGWGACFGLAWLAVVAALARDAWRTADPRRAAMRRRWGVLLAGTVLISLRLAWAWRHADRLTGVEIAAFGVALALFTTPLLLASFAPAIGCLTLARRPHADADASLQAALGVASLGAVSTVVADEPLWPLTLGVVAVGAVVAARTLRREARAIPWLRAVAAGRVEAWTLRAHEGRAWLARPRCASSYRSADDYAAVAPVDAVPEGDGWRVTPPRSRPELTAHGAIVAVCLLGAIGTHGYVDARGCDRIFVINREPPAAAQARLWPGKRLRRLRSPRIPGVELWRNCAFESCRGVTIAVDERGEVLEVPAVMARVRAWSPLAQARVRYALLANGGRSETVVSARRCGRRLWARVQAHWGSRTVILDPDTGARAAFVDRARAMDCVEPAVGELQPGHDPL